jgi:hypothetical protein
MYELIVKVMGEIESRRYTIVELQEMKEILKDLQTIEVRLRRLDNVRIVGKETSSRGKRKSL